MTIAIDVDALTEAELIELNYRIVERLRFLQHARAHVRMMNFAIGERVMFLADTRCIVGIVTKYNQKTVTIVAEDGARWNVSPGLLSGLTDSQAALPADA